MISKSSKTLIPIFVIGSGDIGCRIARLWQQQGATVRTLGRRAAPCGSSTAHLCADLDQPATLQELPTTGAIIYFTAPPPAQGSDDPRMKNLLAAIDPAALPQRIIYISTSGVYGDCRGEWVDENHPTNPQAPRSQRRLAAEQALTQWGEQHNVATVVLRVGGIYGPGRLPLERLRPGTTSAMTILQRDIAPYSNRIHADDLARVCVAAATAPLQHALYNVSDGHPTTMSDYFIRVAAAAGLPAPLEVDWATAEKTMSAEMLSYLHEAKRLDNRKMLQELGITLLYPTLDEGLPACGLETGQ